jgi:signal peptidase I
VAWARNTTQDSSHILDRLNRAAQAQRKARKTARTILQALAFGGLVLLFFLRVPEVEGRSMLPSVAGGNHVLINTLAYGTAVGPWTLLSRAVQRGDVIAFSRGLGDDSTTYLKRVVALPGDRVDIRDGRLQVNGVDVDETAFALADRSSMSQLRIPAECVFVLGDNRAESDDSRVFGPIPESAIIGKAVFVIWPIGDIKTIP